MHLKSNTNKTLTNKKQIYELKLFALDICQRWTTSKACLVNEILPSCYGVKPPYNVFDDEVTTILSKTEKTENITKLKIKN